MAIHAGNALCFISPVRSDSYHIFKILPSMNCVQIVLLRKWLIGVDDVLLGKAQQSSSEQHVWRGTQQLHSSYSMPELSCVQQKLPKKDVYCLCFLYEGLVLYSSLGLNIAMVAMQDNICSIQYIMCGLMRSFIGTENSCWLTLETQSCGNSIYSFVLFF